MKRPFFRNWFGGRPGRGGDEPARPDETPETAGDGEEARRGMDAAAPESPPAEACRKRPALPPDSEAALTLLRIEAENEGDPAGFARGLSLFLAELDDRSRVKPGALSLLAHALGRLGRWDEAIAAVERAIAIEPDNPALHLNLGAYLAWKVFYGEGFRIGGDRGLIDRSLCAYRACLQKDPTVVSAWLNTIETRIWLFDWDQAIGTYGQCGPFMETPADRLVRAWLGSIALALAGEEILPEDRAPLDAPPIPPLPRTSYDVNQIERFFEELARRPDPPRGLPLAREIHRSFLARVQIVTADKEGD